MPIYDATMSFPCANTVFTRAALLVLLSFTKLRAVGKEFVPLGDEKGCSRLRHCFSAAIAVAKRVTSAVSMGLVL